MSRKMWMFVAFAGLIVGCFAQKSRAQEEAYTGVLQVRGAPGVAGNQIQITLRITKWSTQDDIKKLGAVLKEKGRNALLEEMRKLDSGRINRTGDTGNQIALAEKSQNGDKTVITLISARRMTIFEQGSRRGGTSEKYPYAFLMLKLNANGEGKGRLVEMAALAYDKEKGDFKLDPHGQGPRLIENVKPLK